MKKNINKADVLAACLQNKEELIKSFEDRVAEARDDAYAQNQSASQSEDRTIGEIDLLNTYENELAFAQSELSFLKSLDAGIKSSKAEPGAIVITNHLTFFIGVSNEKIEMNGEEIVCVSTNAPLYKMMEGLQKNDHFHFNETQYKIENIY